MSYENLVPIEKIGGVNIKDINMQKLRDTLPSTQFNFKQPTIPEFKNPMLEEQKKLNNTVDQLKKQLSSIQYENMKLNAQIEVMNKTIDSDSEELLKFQTANSELKAVNQTLKDNNKHYWLYTTLITLLGAIVGFLLGKYF